MKMQPWESVPGVFCAPAMYIFLETGRKKMLRKENNRLHWMVKTGLLAAVAFVLMYIEFPLPIAPPWLKLDISDFPALLAGFALGPVSGCVVEAIKVVLFFFLKNSGTGGVGELANLLMGLAFVLPSAWIYLKHKNFKGAIIGTLIGVAAMAVAGGALNYWLLIPAYSKFMPIEAIIAACQAINPAVDSVLGYVLVMAVPFTLLKGLLDGVLVFLVYKKISPLLHK